jgi:hypothetical protein
MAALYMTCSRQYLSGTSRYIIISEQNLNSEKYCLAIFSDAGNTLRTGSFLISEAARESVRQSESSQLISELILILLNP